MVRWMFNGTKNSYSGASVAKLREKNRIEKKWEEMKEKLEDIEKKRKCDDNVIIKAMKIEHNPEAENK